MKVNHMLAEIELTRGLIKFQILNMCFKEYFYLTASEPFRYSYKTKGMTVVICRRNLQEIRRYLVASMFMIQPGIMAPVVTEYKRTIHAILLPEIYYKIPPSSPDLNLHTIIFTLSS